MRLGVIGTGRIGSQHAAVLAGRSEVDEVIVCDVDGTRARAVAAQIGGSAAEGTGQLYAARPDGVLIAAPTSQHADLIREAVRAHVPVFCEKPVAQSLAETVATVEEAEASGVAVQIGFQRRFDAGCRRVREAIAGGEVGELRRMHLMTCDPAPPPAEYVPHSGGIFRDCHIHDFDILRFVSGREVESVTALGANRGADFFAAAGDVDESVVLLTLDDGTLVTMQGSRYNGAGYDVRLEAAGTQGTVMAGLSGKTPVRSTEPGVVFPDDAPWAGFLERFADAYVAELVAFLDVVGTGAPVVCTPRDALEALYTAEAADLSRREGRTVRIAEVRS
ncbi:dehydrogenase [Microbacterium protaetiae]|uniref:Dehydrogenase n=1 Tax=Microbacterium protaetiae TaxID=2509458 RepID=A0A4P6EAN0_9MICO|nr:Gfo/Idh/MocA family oxidoreductase [Microbacterium protaetiae]QAY59190.1 dehydrogenase [Microbacterium protaetiae]